MFQKKPKINNQSSDFYSFSNCRRSRQDRRRRQTPWLSKYTFIGSRRQNRRREDCNHNYYVDVYDSDIIKLVLLIFFLCILDAVLTILLLNQGASELNPIMDYYLGLGKEYFLAVKTFCTSIGLLILLIHQNFRRVRKIIKYICAFYGLVITYQLALLIVSIMS
jgi:hypothetical protein